jgi:hypothetical protein
MYGEYFHIPKSGEFHGIQGMKGLFQSRRKKNYLCGRSRKREPPSKQLSGRGRRRGNSQTRETLSFWLLRPSLFLIVILSKDNRLQRPHWSGASNQGLTRCASQVGKTIGWTRGCSLPAAAV